MRVLLLRYLLIDGLHELLLLLKLLLGLWRLDHLLRKLLLELLCRLTSLLSRDPGHWCLQHLCLRGLLKIGTHKRGLRLSLTVEVCHGQRCLWLTLLALLHLLVVKICHWQGLEAAMPWIR